VPAEVLGEWLPRPGVSDVPAVPADEAERLAGRLKYLCQLVAERRRPYCPANGIVWLIPVAGTTTEAIADRTAAACRADSLAAEAGLQVHCPAAAVICDAQDLPGFRDLLRGLPEPLARERLLGRSFPLVPAVPPEKRPEVLFNGIDWVARSLVPGVTYQRFGSEAEGNGERWSAANQRLWLLLNELYARRAAIVRLLGQGITDGNDRLPMLAGAYLAGTGPAEQDQAFVAGVVQQLIGLQNNVGWTPAALAEERDYRRMTAIGYAAALALVIAVGVFAYLSWLR
jgi:type VI protein secretion system component VasK